MTRMANPEQPRDELDEDDEHFEDEGRHSIFSALWFRAILVVVILGVVAAVAVPYILEMANQPPPKPMIVTKPEPARSPPSASTPPTMAPSIAPAPPVAEKPPVPEKPAIAEKPPAPMTPAAPEKPAAATKKPDMSASVSPSAKEPAAPRSSAAAPSGAPTSGAYFVQVGAFKSPDLAKKLAARLRESKYSVEETSTSNAPASRAAAAPPSAGASGSDKYDVYVTGGAPAEINAKLSPKGFTSEPASGGVVVKPSLPLRDAVALSKDLAVDGLKVQVRRAAGAPSSAPAPRVAPSGDTVYRVRVGPFDDRTAAVSTLRELEQRGYTPFIARGGQ